MYQVRYTIKFHPIYTSCRLKITFLLLLFPLKMKNKNG